MLHSTRMIIEESLKYNFPEIEIGYYNSISSEVNKTQFYLFSEGYKITEVSCMVQRHSIKWKISYRCFESENVELNEFKKFRILNNIFTIFNVPYLYDDVNKFEVSSIEMELKENVMYVSMSLEIDKTKKADSFETVRAIEIKGV